MPFDPSKLIREGGSMETCSMPESIAHNIMLLITTKKKENRFDPDYGNAVWDLEFENGVTTSEWEKVFIKSLKEEIAKYEPRIKNPKIDAHIEYVEHSYNTKQFSEMKKRAKIAINAKLTDTNETYSFTTEIFLSPMSID